MSKAALWVFALSLPILALFLLPTLSLLLLVL